MPAFPWSIWVDLVPSQGTKSAQNVEGMPASGYMDTVAVALSTLLLIAAFVATAAMVMAAIRMPAPVPPRHGRFVPPLAPDRDPEPRRDRVRLLSRLLFARRSFDAITLDCTLVAVDGELPPDIDPPEGLPFTLRVRCPETTWFATRVEELLSEWAEDNRELVLELSPDKGKVRTTIARA